jgi:hypothetical protein
MAAGFMAGFGTKFSELIEEDRKYYRDRAAKRQDYLQTYGTRAVAEREDKANAALGVANTLINKGFSKDYVTHIATNNGVRSMVDFADQITKRTDLTEKDIKEIEASAKDFVKDNPQEDLTSVVKRAYGLYKSTKDPVQRKRNIFGAMLGLDASMMEDDVLNDMYIDGYTGRDIYRIMGSAGPGAGKPMGVKLPPKAFTFRQNNDFLTVSMIPNLENSLEQEKTYFKNILANNPSEEVAKNATQISQKLDGIETLIKGRKYSEAMQDYLQLEGALYTSSFVGSLQQLDERMPGAVTRNPLLTEGFLTTYKKEIGDIKDDEAAAKAPGTQEPKGDGKVDEPPKKTTHKVTSEAEALELITSGKVKIGDDIDINGTIRPVKNLPESVSGPGPSVPFDLSLDGLKGDRSPREDVVPSFSSNVTPETVAKVEQAFDPVVADEKELTVEDQAEQRYDAVQSTIDDTKQSLGEAVISTAEVLDDINAIGDRAAVKAKWAVGTRIATGMGAIAQYLGYEDLAKGWYQWSIKNQDRGSTSPLLTQQINDMLDVLGVPDFSEGVNLPEKDKTAKQLVTEIFDDVASMSDEEKAAKIEELKAVAVKYKESKDGTSMEDRIKDDSRQFIQDEKSYPQPLDRIVIDTKQDVETMEDRIRDDARQFLQDEKSFPQPLPNIVIDDLEDGIVSIVQQLIKKRQAPTERDVKALKARLKSSQYRGPISDKTLKEKLDDIYNFYTQEETEYNPRTVGTVGFQDLGLRSTADDVRYPRSDSPDAQTRTRAPLGDTRTEPDATVPSISAVDTSARPSGLMSPDKDTRKVNVGDLATFADPQLMDNIKTAHGSGSKTFKDFEKKISSGTMKPADITRLIKATRKLPNTKSKDKLLNSLFDLRDALNKR